MGLPTCLAPLQLQNAERVAYGDSSGEVQLLLCGARELPARDLLRSERHRDLVTLHREHSDWVSRVSLRLQQVAGPELLAAAAERCRQPWALQRLDSQPATPLQSLPPPDQSTLPCPAPPWPQLKFVPEVGLVSASMDCSIKTFDLVREKVVQTFDLHAKGVKDFAYCK
jgi:hypothetical protein